MQIKNITYTTSLCYLDGTEAYHPVYMGKTIAEPYRSRQKALDRARRFAEAIRQDYIERGIRARTILVDPAQYAA